MIKVCDSLMGTGKTSAAISYMNEHPYKKFIFVTPYLEEAKRIKDSCPNLHFVEPSKKIPEFNFSKINHTAELVQNGRNVATTHQALKDYPESLLDSIRKGGYTLILDEGLEMLEQFSITTQDLLDMKQLGYIAQSDSSYHLSVDKYEGSAFSEYIRFLKARDILLIDGDDPCNKLYYWLTPPNLLSAFQDVIVLTYLFEAQSLHHLLKMNNIHYYKIGVVKSENGSYHFANQRSTVPDYALDIKNKIHVLDHKRMNKIGEDYFALSAHWFDTHEEDVRKLKNAVNNFFRNLTPEFSAESRLWGSYKDAFTKLRGKGFSNSFLAFNARATNNYRDKTCIAYLANPFMNPFEKRFYTSHGVFIDEEKYALSILVQWLWRSAIRDGKEVTLYLPSKRMRNVLENWMNDLQTEGGDAIEQKNVS